MTFRAASRFSASGIRVLGLLFLTAVCAGVRPATAVTTPTGYFSLIYSADTAMPTSLAFGPDGWLYVASLQGTIKAVYDTDGNNQADTTVTFATGLVRPLGIAHHNGSLYVSSLGIVTRHTDTDGDHTADVVDTLVTGLPFGQHQNSGIAFDDRGDMFVTVGSATSTGPQGHPWLATILRFSGTGVFQEIYAEGLRNPYDLAFHESGELFAADNSPGADSTWNCSEAPDELNWIRKGRHYGFPECFGVGDCADLSAYCSPPPCGPGDCQTGAGCTPDKTAPIWQFDPHSSPNGLTFAAGMDDFDGDDLFVAEFGQNVPVPGCITDFGHVIRRVRIKKVQGKWETDFVEEFAGDFNSPLDVVVGPDKALYVADFGTGFVHRIAKTGQTGVGDSNLPARLKFLLSPNPATHAVTMYWERFPEDRPVTVAVYDVSGRRVARLPSPAEGNGAHVVWNLRDEAGRRVRPGLYWLRAQSGPDRFSGKVLVLD